MKLWMQPLGPIQTNGYVLSNEQGEALIIDPGMEPEPMLEYIQDFHVQAILLTHAHFDHIGGLAQVREATGAPVYIHTAEAEWLTTPEKNGSLRWASITEPMVFQPAEHLLSKDGEELELVPGLACRVLHAPGHSPGSLVYHFAKHNLAIVGDTLFAGSIGRTDIPDSDPETLMHSLREKLMNLPDSTTIYPGHGPKTTIAHEKVTNPFLLALQRR